MPRRDWEALGEAQRRRYISAGRTGKLSGSPGLSEAESRRYYESGQSLDPGRGHGTFREGPGGSIRVVQTAPSDIRAKRYIVDSELLDRVSLGLSQDQDRKDLETWRKRRAPSWLPKDRSEMSDEVAALISSTGEPPSRWRKVETFTRPDGSVRVEVTTARGTQSFLLPDRDALHEFTTWLPTARAGSEKNPADVSIGSTDLARKRPTKASSSKKKKASKKASARKAPARKSPQVSRSGGKKAAPKKASKKAAAPARKAPARKARAPRVPTLGEIVGDAIEAAGNAIEAAGDALP